MISFKEFTVSLLLLMSLEANAQQPEQDCISAIPVTAGSYYHPVPYQGWGAVNEISSGISCHGLGEQSSAWYRFTVANTGNFGFVIIPDDSADDYDWSVFDITSYDCQDIYSTAAMEVSCNYSGVPGTTGPNGGSSSTWQQGPGTPYNAMIPVQAGDTLAIYVGCYNPSNNAQGYTIIFSDSSALLTSTRSLTADPVVRIAPNPVSDHSWITLPRLNEQFEISLYNSDGSLVRTYNNVVAPKLYFDRGDLAPGLYLCQIKGSKGYAGHGKLVIVPR